MDIKLKKIIEAYCEPVYYDEEIPFKGELDFYEIENKLIIKLDDGNYYKFSDYWQGSYSEIKIDTIDSCSDDDTKRNDNNWKKIYNKKIIELDFWYRKKTFCYQEENIDLLSDTYMKNHELLGIKIKFDNGKKLIIISGQPEDYEQNQVFILGPSSLIMVVFDSNKYDFLNLPEGWK